MPSASGLSSSLGWSLRRPHAGRPWRSASERLQVVAAAAVAEPRRDGYGSVVIQREYKVGRMRTVCFELRVYCVLVRGRGWLIGADTQAVRSHCGSEVG